MDFRKSILFGAWALLVLNLVLAFGTVGLMTRMTPVIENILAENDRSIEACGEMLAVLAELRTPAGRDEGKRRFDLALGRAEGNITEEAEAPVIARIRDGAGPALGGEPAAIAREVAAIRELAAINRRAMTAANARAQRLGVAGAWGAVIIACVSSAAILIFINRLDRLVLVPLGELESVLAANEHGDAFRRCSTAGIPAGFHTVFARVNALIDRCRSERP